MQQTDTIESPRLWALQRELDVGHSAAVDAFWEEVTARGAPLIEALADYPDRALVTFLWRATEPIENVIVMSPLVGFDEVRNGLRCLPGTDLWYRTYPADRTLRLHYFFYVNYPFTPEAEQDELRYRRIDPLNPRQLVLPRNDELDRDGFRLSVLELPDAEPQLWNKPRSGTPSGLVHLLRLRSEILNNERSVWAYTPPGYGREGSPYPLLLLFDGWPLTQLIPTPTILDNLIADRRLPPVVAILLDNLGPETRLRELGGFLPFIDFLAEEVVPWARGRYFLTSDARQTIIGGISGGGFTAALAGLRHPDVFGKVLSHSGSFFWTPDVAMPEHQSDTGEEWLEQQYLSRQTQILAVYVRGRYPLN